jgi:PAS domain S-box-containing protein
MTKEEFKLEVYKRYIAFKNTLGDAVFNNFSSFSLKENVVKYFGDFQSILVLQKNDKNQIEEIFKKNISKTFPLNLLDKEESEFLIHHENVNFLTLRIEEKWLSSVFYFVQVAENNVDKESINKIQYQKLKNKSKFFENIFESLPADLVVFSEDKRYLHINNHAIPNTERREWLIGKKDEDFLEIRPELKDIFEKRAEYFEKTLHTKKTTTFQEFFDNPDGNSSVVLRNLKPILNPKEEIEYVLGYGLDITELYNTKGKLNLSKSFHKTVNSATYKLLFSKDIDSGVEEALKELSVQTAIDRISIIKKSSKNAHFEIFKSYSCKMNLGVLEQKDILKAEDYFNHLTTLKNSKSTISILKEKSHYLSAIGVDKSIFIPVFLDNEFWAIFQIDFVKNGTLISETEDVSLYYFANFVAVIIKNSELIELNEKVTNIYRVTTDYVALYDIKTNTIDVNKAASKVFEISNTEKHKVKLSDFYNEETYQYLLSNVLPVLQQKGTWKGILKLKKKNGEAVSCSTSILAHKNNKGEITFYSIIARDNSEIEKLNEELVDTKELIENIFNASPNNLIAISPVFDAKNNHIEDFRILTYNNNSKELFKLNQTENLLSKYIENFDKTSLFLIATKVFETKGKIYYELKGLFTNDENWYRVVAIPLKNGVSITISDITDRKNNEIERHKDRQELKRAQRIASLANWKLNIKTKELQFSEQFYKIFNIGVESQTLQFNELKQLINANDFHKFNEKCKINFAQKKKAKEVIRFYLGNEERFAEVIAEAVFDLENNVLEVYGTVQDITSQKKGEFELFKIKKALEKTNEEVYLFDLNTLNFDFVNKASLNNLGYSEEEIMHLKPSSFFAEFKEDRFRRTLIPLIRREKTYLELEGNFVRKNKTTYPVKVKITVFDFQGRLWCLALVEDISEKKKVLDTIIENERVLKEAQALANFGSWQYDKKSSLLSWTDQVFVQFGINKTLTTPHFLNDYITNVHPDDREKTLANINDSIEKNQIISFRHRIYTKDKKELKTLDVIVKPAFWENEKPRGVMGTFIDITDKMKAEEQLKKAKILAEQSVKAKENFLANMSHEMRTPLNGIIGVTNLIHKTNLGEDQEKLIKIIEDSSETLLSIINDLLDLTKIDAGKIVFESIPFDLIDKLNASLQVFEIKAKQKNIAFDTDISIPENRIVVGDPLRLVQIINNLVGNAIKFTPDNGNINVGLQIDKIDEENQNIILKVKDNGIGIDLKQQSYIFEDFTQASSDITRKYGGTGLGLSITKRLVKLMGGTIELESEKGKGSIFTVKIPVKISQTDINMDLEENNNSDKNFLDNKRILLAEDNKVNRFLAVKLLNSWSSSLVIDEAENGKIAYDFFVNNNYDLILLDIQMPEMSGLDFIKLVRNYSDADKNKIPVIALTANVLESDAQEYLKMGMNDFIGKPFKEDTLIMKLRKWMSKNNASYQIDIVEELKAQKVEEVKNNNKRYDLITIETISRGNQAFINQMLNLFFELSNQTIDNLNASINKEDYFAIKQAAHKIKPSLESLKIYDLKAKAIEIEADAIAKTSIDLLKEKADYFIKELTIVNEEIKNDLR